MSPKWKSFSDMDLLLGSATMGIWQSSGEAQLSMVANCLLDYSKSGMKGFLVLDEPEVSLDLKRKSLVAKSLRRLISQGGSLIVSTHDIVILSAFDQVYDVSQRKVVPRKEYVERILNE